VVEGVDVEGGREDGRDWRRGRGLGGVAGLKVASAGVLSASSPSVSSSLDSAAKEEGTADERSGSEGRRGDELATGRGDDDGDKDGE
jgi:hypothetical protein